MQRKSESRRREGRDEHSEHISPRDKAQRRGGKLYLTYCRQWSNGYNPMALRTVTSTINSYHNYRLGNRMAGELRMGDGDSEREDRFFLSACMVEHPAPFPRISLNLFNRSGERVVTLKNSHIVYLKDGYRSEINGKDIAILDGKGEIFLKIGSREYQNVYVTDISGSFCDETGTPREAG